MSLEARIEALTKSVDALTNRIDSLLGAAGADVKHPAADAATVENTGATQAATTKPTTTTKAATTTKPTPPKAKPEAEAPDDTNVVEYNTVKNAVIKLAAGKGRDAAVAVLNTFGVDNAQKLKPEQFSDALEALELAAA